MSSVSSVSSEQRVVWEAWEGFKNWCLAPAAQDQMTVGIPVRVHYRHRALGVRISVKRDLKTYKRDLKTYKRDLLSLACLVFTIATVPWDVMEDVR